MPREQHGLTDTPEYRVWTNMKTRCYNSKSIGFKDYGARGIRVCDPWLKSFTAFLRDMGKRPTDRHSIERIDPSGDYSPSNCVWATPIQQANNKRSTVRVSGSPLAEVARAAGVKRGTLYYRVKRSKRGHDPLSPQVLTLKHAGIEDTVAGWSMRTGIKASTITMRVKKYGWPVSKALTKGASECASSL